MPESLDYNPMFVTFCEGLRETQHPFKFIVARGLEDLIDASGAYEKIRVLMGSVVGPLRSALGLKDRVSNQSDSPGIVSCLAQDFCQIGRSARS